MGLIKYGERRFVEQFFRDGSLQLKPIRTYDPERYGRMIGDANEGRTVQKITDANINEFLAAGFPMPTALGVPLFYANGAGLGNVFRQTKLSPNYLAFCLSLMFSRQTCESFEAGYDAAYLIEDPPAFMIEVTKALEASGLVPHANYRYLGPVFYLPRTSPAAAMLNPVQVKDVVHADQYEIRSLWDIGEPTAEHYRFAAPEAVKCCLPNPVMLGDMPNNADGMPIDECYESWERGLRLAGGPGFRLPPRPDFTRDPPTR